MSLRHTFRIARPDEDEWPPELTTISSPPKSLHYTGDIGVLAQPCVAIVGSRHPTAYGERVARELSSALASAGACIVSGMAFGVDAIAHRAALECGGATAAVLGTGIDIVYPRSHAALHDEIAEHGVVLSEFAPGTGTFQGCFPRRNRIIAGLCRLTIVVEAGARSGALITAGYAGDFGRNVAAVPGPIDSPQSAGAQSAAARWRSGHRQHRRRTRACGSDRAANARVPLSLGGDEATVWDAVAQHAAASADEIITRTGWPASRCLAALTQLEIQGLLECSAGGVIARR